MPSTPKNKINSKGCVSDQPNQLIPSFQTTPTPSADEPWVCMHIKCWWTVSLHALTVLMTAYCAHEDANELHLKVLRNCEYVCTWWCSWTAWVCSMHLRVQMNYMSMYVLKVLMNCVSIYVSERADELHEYVLTWECWWTQMKTTQHDIQQALLHSPPGWRRTSAVTSWSPANCICHK